MTALTVVAADISADWDRGSVLANYIANEAVDIGMAVYLDANNKVNKAKGDTSAHAMAVGIVVGAPNFYGEKTVNAGDYAAVCVQGPVFGFTSLINGENIYVDKTTAGSMNDASPTGGVYVYAIGHAIGADTIFVDPGGSSPVSTA